MSSHYLSTNFGSDNLEDSSVTVATSSTAGANIELRVVDGTGVSPEEVNQQVLKLLRYYIFVANLQGA